MGVYSVLESLKQMRDWSIRILTFVAALIVATGAVSIWQWIYLRPLSELHVVIPAVVSEDKSKWKSVVVDCDLPEFDDSVDYAKRLRVKLLQTGNFHSDEVPYRAGEKWLALFKGRNEYFLKETQLRIKRIPNDLYDTAVDVTDKDKSVFLLRGISDLRPGPVETVYHDSNNDFDSYFGDDPVKRYRFLGREYVLRVETTENGYLRADSSLVLETDSKIQILRSLPNGCDDCGWSVEWVGDLDRDGKLDFLLDLNRHYNSYEPTLFLSTPEGHEKIVRILAGFHAVGC